MLKWAVCLALALSGVAAPAIAQSLTAFTPLGNATLAASTSSANVALPVLGTEIITNTGTVTAYVKFGGASVTAATTDTPIAPSQTVVFNSGINVNIAAITGSSTATLTITSGSGWPNMAGGGGIGTGGAVNATITGPLARQADAGSVAVGLSTEDVAILNSATPAGANVIGFTSNDPCAQATKLHAGFESASSGGNLITGTAAKITYICSMVITVSTQANVSLCEATSTACSGGTPAAVFCNTSTTAANGCTVGASATAPGGMTYGDGGHTLAKTATTGQNVDVLFSTGNTPQVNVDATYVQQ